MKKYISVAIFLGCLALSPNHLVSSVFSIKVGMGLSFGGRISDIWTTTTDYFIQETEKEIENFLISFSFSFSRN